MEHDALVQVFTQIIEGWDIPTPKGMLRVRKEVAAAKQENLPYSLATNLAHAVYWQNIWLGKLNGAKAGLAMETWKSDWREASAEDWEPLRKEFVSGLEQAKEIAAKEPDARAVELLIRIAVHASYHMGQMNLLKRAK